MNRPINVINSDLEKCFYFEISRDIAVNGYCGGGGYHHHHHHHYYYYYYYYYYYRRNKRW